MIQFLENPALISGTALGILMIIPRIVDSKVELVDTLPCAKCDGTMVTAPEDEVRKEITLDGRPMVEIISPYRCVNGACDNTHKIKRYERTPIYRDTEVAGTFPKLPVRHGPGAYD